MHLSDCFIELFAYTAFMVRDARGAQPGYEEVRGTLQRLIGQSESAAQADRVIQEDYHLARFAVFAWIDETISSSGWEGRHQWQREQLQRLYYQTADAGELFYERLNSIGPHQRDVREVYFMCLALGFTGQYCNAGDDFMLGQLRNANLKQLTGSTMAVPSVEEKVLFPEAYPAITQDQPDFAPLRRWSVLTLVGAAAPLVLFGFMYLIYMFILGNIGNNLMGTVP
jgi:type VI secretion system protein ImpK